MKKIITAFISSIVALSVSMSSFAAVPLKSEGKVGDEIVTFIVEVEGDPLLASETAAEIGMDYLDSPEAKSREEDLLHTQARIMSEISEDTELEEDNGYTYTAVFNGFSVDAPKSKMKEIEALPGVKNVYIAENRKTMLASAVEQGSSLPADTADDVALAGYSGEGQVVAVIDSEFDTGHAFFNQAPENPKLSKEAVGDIISKNTMNVDVTANQAYKSEKIPFAYDYVNKTSDTYSNDPNVIHGTHVAGIVAGSNGSFTAKSETGQITKYTFSGVAPEAQLVLMKVGTSGGYVSDAAAVAAIDDAVKLGVCAINLSFGSAYVSKEGKSLYSELFDNTKNAGIMLCVSSGNEGMGYESESAPVEMIDYSTAGIPAIHSTAIAVASANNAKAISSLGILTAADGQNLFYKNAFSSSTFHSAYSGKQVEYVDCGLGFPEDFSGKEVSGKVALIGRGNLDFTEKADNAKTAGAEAIIFYNTEDGTESLPSTYELSLPAAMIDKSSGEILKNAETKTVTVSAISSVYKTAESGGKVSAFSSWGVDETLELKPEISAPGGKIYSSVPDDKYAVYSGTSMASPYIAGVSALINEYLDKNGISLSGAERVNRIENMLMSAADIIRQPERNGDATPYSPRVQGAGLVNTAQAMKTPAILIGDAGKTKVSLGDGIEDRFTLQFSVQNLSNQEITYDKVSLELLTDGYVTDSESGQNYVTLDDSVPLTVLEDTLANTITVPANGQVSISTEVVLDRAELEENSKIFTNGFFIDGFVILGKSDASIPDISMPFCGFRGDWTKAPIFDKTMYDEGGSVLHDANTENLEGTYLWTTNVSDGEEYNIPAGKNADEEYDKEKIAISPNGDGKGDTLGVTMTLWRAAKDVSCSLLNAQGDIVLKTNISNVLSKYTPYAISMDAIEEQNETTLPDGEYTFTVSGAFNYDGAKTETLEFPVAVDREEPEITGVSVVGDTLTVTANDNRYVCSISIIYQDKNGESVQKDVFVDGKEGADAAATFDITGIEPEDITIEVWDYALNMATASVMNASGKVIANMTKYDAVGNLTSATVELKNTDTSNVTGDAMIAFYDVNNVLVAWGSQEINIGVGETASCSFDLFANTQNAAKAKLFIWDGIGNMQPQDKVKNFNLLDN